MKILLANSSSKVGGVSTFMLSLRTALISLGHTCDLFFFSHGTMDAHLPSGAAHFGSLTDCMRFVERERIDVVHANNIDWATGISAVRQLGATLVLTAHKVRDEARTYGWTRANCDAFTAVSNWVTSDLQPYTDVPVQVVRNGVDTSAFSPAPAASTAAPPIVAWIGRGASPLKRLDLFAAIAPALHQAGVRIWVVDQHGIDESARALPDAVATLRPIAEFWGARSFAEMPSLYRETAASGGCVISTSSREGLGLGLLEAQACGCMAVGPDVPGVNEAISPAHGGVLFPPGMDPADIARLVLATLGDRPALEQRCREAAAYVREHFSRERMAAEYVRIYTEAPLPAAGRFMPRIRARLRLSPLVNWHEYLDSRWGVGQEQYGTMREFATRGEWRLAAAAGRESFRTSPTIFVRPGRVAELAKVHMRG